MPILLAENPDFDCRSVRAACLHHSLRLSFSCLELRDGTCPVVVAAFVGAVPGTMTNRPLV
jgi:hypothetical protein